MIYLDNQATTPCDPAVIEAMSRELHNNIGNPSSSHVLGELASGRLRAAVKQIAEIINAEPDEVVITSGATESNNLSILGLARGIARSSERKKIITTKIEHKSVLGPLQHLQKEGWIIEYLPVGNDGTVQLDKAVELIDDSVALISLQLANSEIGTIQPLEEISDIAKSTGTLLHCDAAQAVGKISVDVTTLGADLVSYSAHKMYGPSGVGALWIRNGIEKLIMPVLYGGGNILRPGTIPVALAVGFGVACQLAKQNFESENKHLSTLRDLFENLLKDVLPGVTINGSKHRLPNNTSVTFPDVDAEALLAQMDDVIASTGSACESGSIEPSRVLTAIGIASETAYSTLRFGFGRFNTEDEIRYAVKSIADAHAVIK